MTTNSLTVQLSALGMHNMQTGLVFQRSHPSSSCREKSIKEMCLLVWKIDGLCQFCWESFLKRRASNYLGLPNYSGFFSIFVFKLISISPSSGGFSLFEETLYCISSCTEERDGRVAHFFIALGVKNAKIKKKSC